MCEGIQLEQVDTETLTKSRQALDAKTRKLLERSVRGIAAIDWSIGGNEVREPTLKADQDFRKQATFTLVLDFLEKEVGD